MKRFFDRLKRHPGAPILAALVAAGMIAGAVGGSPERAAFGAVVMLLVFGPAVFATLPEDGA